MSDLKTKKLVCVVVSLMLCLLFFTFQFTRTASFPHIDTNVDVISTNYAKVTTGQPRTYTYDSKWKAKKYPPPSKQLLEVIMSNVLSHQKRIIKSDPLGKKNSTETSNKDVLLTAVVNSGMINYTLNWIESLKRIDQDDKFLVFAIDQGVVDHLTSRGYTKNVILIPEEWFHVPLAPTFALWKSDDYRPITHAKTLIVERLLYMNIIVWFSDVDIVFLNPHILDAMLVQMSDRPNTHMLFSQEVEHRTVNSGFYMMKPSRITKQFIAKIIEEQDKPNNQLTQQKIMNRVLKAMFPRDYEKSPYRLLDLLLYPNGKYYFRMNVPKRLGFKPMIVHANYLIGGEKMASLAKAGLWFIE